MALELNGTTGVSLVQDDTITDAKLALDANASEIKDALNATGSAPIYACRAWVNFDGTTNTGGNCDIRDSGNVSSVTDNGTGDYTVNFTTAMPDANYSVSGVCYQPTNPSSIVTPAADPSGTERVPTTTAFRFAVVERSGGVNDTKYTFIAVFR